MNQTAAASWSRQSFRDEPFPFVLAALQLARDPTEPARLADGSLQLPRQEPEQGLVLSGIGPLWIYGALSLQADQAAWVATYDPRLRGAIVVARRTRQAPPLGTLVPAPPNLSGLTSSEDWSIQEENQPAGKIPQFELLTGPNSQVRERRLHLAPTADQRFYTPDCLPEACKQVAGLLQAIPPEEEPGLLVLDGPFPVWLASALAAHIARIAPSLPIALYDPKLAGSVVIRPDQRADFPLGLLLPDVPPQRQATVIGVIGDPNSGKSVLTEKLYRALQNGDLAVYRLDCDASAPTPPWSVANELGAQLRRQVKEFRGGWRPEDPLLLERTVHRLRRSRLEIVLLDLPGGIHKGVPAPIRIPDDRRNLFEMIDAFILLERDQSARDGWLAALAEQGLEDRIACLVAPQPDLVPEDRHSEETFSESGQPVPRWRIAGLDRRLLNISTPNVGALAEYLRSRHTGWHDERGLGPKQF